MQCDRWEDALCETNNSLWNRSRKAKRKKWTQIIHDDNIKGTLCGITWHDRSRRKEVTKFKIQHNEWPADWAVRKNIVIMRRFLLQNNTQLE